LKTFTVEEAKRAHVREIIEETLRGQKLKLIPKTISCSDNIKSDYTAANFSFEEVIGENKRLVSLKKIKASGFVDCIFQGCLEEYSEQFRSLNNLTLTGFAVSPNFSYKKNNLGSDSTTEVVINMKIKGMETVEFVNRSKSVLTSTYQNVLSVFQFYVNCEKSFHKLRSLTLEADSRNRGDISSVYRHRLSFLTEVNEYMK